VLHPASNEEIGSVACATGEEIDDAVHAARLACWSQESSATRCE
jgi:acyl-CoA reductase-like NAD-dependent aldehyde dehydrogenase